METPSILFGIPISILIDTRATKFFVSLRVANQISRKEGFMENSWVVEYAN